MALKRAAGWCEAAGATVELASELLGGTVVRCRYFETVAPLKAERG